VAFQQHPDGLSSHTRNQFALDHFLGQQTYRPATSTFRRRRANDGDYLLALVLVQRRCFARMRGIEQRSI
jgi:hypothetical protein